MKDKTKSTLLLLTFIMLGIMWVMKEPGNTSFRDFFNKAERTFSVGDPNKYVWGVDLSTFNGLHDDASDYDNYDDESFFKQIKEKGAKFVFIRFGVTIYNGIDCHDIYDDQECAKKLAEYCQKYGLYYGYYFVTDAQCEKDMKKEIKFIKNFISSDKSKYHKFPVILDHEIYYGDGYDCNYTARLQYLAEMSKNLMKDGYEAWIYMSESRYYEAQSYAFPANQKFWLGKWNYVVQPEKTDYNLLANFAENVVAWQYADDSNQYNDRGINYPQALDRNLMSEATYRKYVG